MPSILNKKSEKSEIPHAPQSVRGLKTVQFSDFQKTKIKQEKDLNIIKENSMSVENSNEKSIDLQESSLTKKKIELSEDKIEIMVISLL
jgi:hypothetical protein